MMGTKSKVILLATLSVALLGGFTVLESIDASNVGNSSTKDKTVSEVDDRIKDLNKKLIKSDKDNEDLKRLLIVEKWLDAKQNNDTEALKKFFQQLRDTMPDDYLQLSEM